MIAFYLPRGHDLDTLINMSVLEMRFYHASMRKYKEDEIEKYKQLFGEG